MQATTDESLFMGRLMPPEEVTNVTSARSEIPEKIREKWCLCGDVTEQFWTLISDGAEEIGYRLSAFTTPNNTAYVTFVIQAREFQTRFLLQLGDATVRAFIEKAQHAGLILSLGQNGGTRALLHPFNIDTIHLRPISALAKKCQVISKDDAFIELCLATRTAMQLQTIPSALPDFDVKHVTLNVILPH